MTVLLTMFRLIGRKKEIAWFVVPVGNLLITLRRFALRVGGSYLEVL